jgi:hypothetical protein
MSIRNIVSNIAIFCSVTVSALALADWFLDDRQHKWLFDKAIKIWNWLDDVRSLNYLDRFSIYKNQRKLSYQINIIETVLIGIPGILLAILDGEFLPFWFAVGTLPTAPINIFYLHPLLLSWATKMKDPNVYLIRSTILLISGNVFVIATIIALHFVTGINPLGGKPQNPISIVILSMVVSTGSVFFYLGYISIFLFFVRILTYVVFGIGRFVLVRIIENPKGLVLGLSALLAAVAALGKSFAGG